MSHMSLSPKKGLCRRVDFRGLGPLFSGRNEIPLRFNPVYPPAVCYCGHPPYLSVITCEPSHLTLCHNWLPHRPNVDRV